jgi:phosphoglycolate phosphatase
VSLRYDLVVFDFDGTLADSLTWFRTALADVVDHHGLPPICEEKAESLRKLSPKAIIDELEIPTWKIPFIAADVRQRAADNVDQIKLFEGIGGLLNQLHAADIKIAMVSSNGEVAVREVLGDDNAALVEQFACGAALFGKAQIFRKVMRKVGASPDRTLCVGDEVRDIEAAREAGCDCGAVTWGFATRCILDASAPDYLFDAVSDIADCTISNQAERAEA